MLIIWEFNLIDWYQLLFYYGYRFPVIRGEEKLVDSVEDGNIVLPLNISKPRQTDLKYEK